jgi:tetratricopeptide (TPR) repeat protein
MPHNLRTAFRGAAQFWRWALAGLFSLAGCLILINASTPLALNHHNITWVHNLCWDEACLAFKDGRLILRSGANFDRLLSNQVSPCQQLWVSRLRMAESSQAALGVLSDADHCPRPGLVAAWQGQLAWNIGELKEARDKWGKLPPNVLSEWAYQLLMQGDIDQGRFILDAALAAAGSSMPASQRYRLLMNLGHSYRFERSWARAVEYYQDAKSLAPDDAEITFYLGMSLRESGAYGEAINVLDRGRVFLTADRPYFASSYYLQLGLAYGSFDQPDRAVENLQAAKTWELREPQPNQEQIRFIENEIARITQR